jgi:hypothetical protein
MADIAKPRISDLLDQEQRLAEGIDGLREILYLLRGITGYVNSPHRGCVLRTEQLWSQIDYHADMLECKINDLDAACISLHVVIDMLSDKITATLEELPF